MDAFVESGERKQAERVGAVKVMKEMRDGKARRCFSWVSIAFRRCEDLFARQLYLHAMYSGFIEM